MHSLEKPNPLPFELMKDPGVGDVEIPGFESGGTPGSAGPAACRGEVAKSAVHVIVREGRFCLDNDR
jgi:hypothetical protein